MRDIVVVGAGIAGLRAVEHLRRSGFTGRLTLVGDETHAPYNRPPLSKQVLGGVHGLAECQVPLAVDATVLLGSSVVGLDRGRRELLFADGRVLYYDGLVIATGCRARTWPEAAGLRGVHTLRSYDDALAFRAAAFGARRVAVVGAGLVGCEVAATLRGAGVEVTVVDQAPRPLMPLGPEIGARAAALHARHGVELRLSTPVAGLAGDGAVAGVRLGDGSLVEADVVLLALGAVPNVEWLTGSGLDADETSGVRCDRFCTTLNDPRIVAAGDVAEFDAGGGERVRIEHWSNSADMAAAAAGNLLLPPGERLAYQPVPTMWTDQYDVRMQSVGFARRAASWQVVDDDADTGRLVIEGVGAGGELVAAVGLNAARQLLRYQARLSAAAAAA